MKIAMINGSPKSKSSTSGQLLKELLTCISNDAVCKEFCFNKSKVDERVVSELKDCDVWVFALPLYVDGVPSQLLSCLYQIEKMGIGNKNIMVFGIVNSGFYEGKQNDIAIEILKNWCGKSELQWGMGIGVGGGGALSKMQSVPLGKGPKKSLGNAFHILKNKIESKTTAEDIYISINLPRRLYKLFAEMGWKQMIKKNGGKAKDLNYRF